MQPTQTLPVSYHEVGTLDITKDQRLIIILNLAGFILLILTGYLFLRALFWLRPDDTVRELQTISISSWLEIIKFILAILALTALHVILHELVHGFFFWVYTHSRPRFAFRWVYAYAAAPGWYLPRNAFLITTLAPLCLISLAGLALAPILSPATLLANWFIMTMNASGSVGDIMVAIWIVRYTSHSLIQDRGDSVTLYIPKKSSESDQNSSFHSQ